MLKPSIVVWASLHPLQSNNWRFSTRWWSAGWSFYNGVTSWTVAARHRLAQNLRTTLKMMCGARLYSEHSKLLMFSHSHTATLWSLPVRALCTSRPHSWMHQGGGGFARGHFVGWRRHGSNCLRFRADDSLHRLSSPIKAQQLLKMQRLKLVSAPRSSGGDAASAAATPPVWALPALKLLLSLGPLHPPHPLHLFLHISPHAPSFWYYSWDHTAIKKLPPAPCQPPLCRAGYPEAACLELKVPEDLSPAVLSHFQLPPSGTWGHLITPACYSSHSTASLLPSYPC